VFAKRLAAAGGVSERDRARVIDRLRLTPGMAVADVGSGSGAWSFAMARVVGPSGVVYAVDTDEDLREEVRRHAARLGLDNVHPVAATPDAPGLPRPVDVVLLVASYHHLPDHVPWFDGLRASLRPGGRVVILESIPGSGLRLPGHDTPPEAVRSALETAGYEVAATADLMRGVSIQAFRPG
jgi:precorrin-6B methylase 2